jgi:cysteine-rich repeat protein
MGCDDGNIVNGDGCTDECTIEPGYDCPVNLGGGTTCTEECSYGYMDNDYGNFACKDGNDLSNDGCAFDCTLETGFYCAGGSPDRPDDCEEVCIDIYDYHTYECEHNNLNENDGCDLYCEIEPAWWCNLGLPPEEPYLSLNEDRIDRCFALCGDGLRAVSAENCDDGSVASTGQRTIHAG